MDDNEEIRSIPLDDNKGLLEILELVESQYKLAKKQYKLAKKHRDIWRKKLLKRTTKPKEEINHGFDRKR